ncbi:MAG: HAMP domain-containing histidine kinase [Planctomycetes bacterium]|nr:HAMP domain-containing histidine kinase [Planctomycetota bacterium]
MAETETETLRILVTDDEAGMRRGAARALEDFTAHIPDVGVDVRFDVALAESGEDALQQIDAEAPHILLLDYKLPGISGLDVLNQVADRHDMLTIMITAYASLDTAVSAVKRGAYDFLAKPFTPAELKNAVRKAAARVILAQQARKLAQEKRRVRFQLISVLAHELKAPLGAVEGYLRILLGQAGGGDPETGRHMVERSLVRLDGMRKLIADLLDMTRIESGQKPREFVALDARDVARQAIETAAPEAARRGIQIDLAADAPVPMTADRGEIEIILNNLVSNAVKYNRDGGRVTVTVSADGDRAVLAVADTGIGLAPEDADRLFNDFVRIRNDQTHAIPGSGLGLSIVRKLAALYGGTAAVRSEPGAGSTFTVTLARDAAAVAPPPAGHAAAP